MRSTKDQARTDKALQAIEDCFNPKNKAMGDAASAFYRSIRMPS